MTSAYLAAEATSLSTRKNGSATGRVWLELNGREFPMRGWDDFIVVILGWWAAALLSVLRNDSGLERVHFMDGPYAVDVSRTSVSALCLRALEGPGRTKEVAIGEAHAASFVLGLITQSREVLNECKRQGWWSSDAETLESALVALELELSRLPGLGVKG